MNSFDLHMHSMYSGDGQFSPKELIDIADKKGLKIISLTDHDAVKGVKEITELGKEKGIRVIPGIECSTILEGNDVHLLGYGIDIENSYFVNLADRLNKLMYDAFYLRVEKIQNKYGIKLDADELIEASCGKNPWFLMWTRIFNDPRYQGIEDFKDYIPGGKRSDPAPVNFFWDKCQAGSDLYVYVENPSFEDSVKKIHEAGGIAVVAHPFKTFYHKKDLLQKALDAGIDGVEVFSNYHAPEHIEYYEEFAKKHNLLITCGSDFHGEKKPSIEMGSYGLEKDGSEYINRFLKALEE